MATSRPLLAFLSQWSGRLPDGWGCVLPLGVVQWAETGALAMTGPRCYPASPSPPSRRGRRWPRRWFAAAERRGRPHSRAFRDQCPGRRAAECDLPSFGPGKAPQRSSWQVKMSPLCVWWVVDRGSYQGLIRCAVALSSASLVDRKTRFGTVRRRLEGGRGKHNRSACNEEQVTPVHSRCVRVCVYVCTCREACGNRKI